MSHFYIKTFCNNLPPAHHAEWTLMASWVKRRYTGVTSSQLGDKQEEPPGLITLIFSDTLIVGVTDY